ncbi:MAG TPA: DUF711 family protein [Chloroflexi bacterium]|nr:DUF711 family protein [Chloroflexota bacterium]
MEQGMKIRSLTGFVRMQKETGLSETAWEQLQLFTEKAAQAFADAGYNPQSYRLASNPFAQYLPLPDVESALARLSMIEKNAVEAGFDYLSIGPASAEEPEAISFIGEAIAATEHVFASAHLDLQDQSGVSLTAVRNAALLIKQLSQVEPNGFGNLYFAALANVPGNIPFFPAGYADVRESAGAYALAMESADMAVEAFSEASDIHEAFLFYQQAIEKAAERLEQVAMELSDATGMHFLGFDFTPAPFVELEQSIGTAIERLSGVPVGHIGSLSAIGMLLSALDQAKFKRSGFNGLMLPILEDTVLAQRSSEGALTIKDLFLFSTVCGTGLDTVPLPGDITEDQLFAILLDLAVLSKRLGKPLTARLMPIPGKAAGDLTDFKFPFFTNARIMPVTGTGIQGLLAEGDWLPVSKWGS